MDRTLGLGSSQGEDSPNLQGVAPVVENWGLLSNRVWLGVFVATRIVYPETQESLTWGRIIITSATAFLAFGVIFPCLHVLPYIFHITEKGVFFQFGNSASRIDVKDIISLSFETRDGRRYFVIKARDKNGLPRERIALMAKKGVTEEDVQRFLYDVNLAHLYVVPADAGNELQEGSRQDLQDLQD